MRPSKVIASTRRKPEKRVRLSKSRAQARTVVPQLEPGAPSDFDLMKGIQTGDADALSQLYDRYNGILKALILRVIHNEAEADRKSTRLNSSHSQISYAVFCLKKKKRTMKRF